MDPRVRELISVKYAEQKSDEWLQLRKGMLTASDAASALGVNFFETQEQFVKKKVLDLKWSGNVATEHGTQLEPLVRDMYDARTGSTSHEIGLVQHRDYAWLGGSPDGVTEGGILLEIKCPLTRKITPKVPEYYMPQIQLLMEILELNECDFVQYKPPEEFQVTRVQRDRGWFEMARPKLEKIWRRIEHGRLHGLCEIIPDPVPFVHTSVPCLLESCDVKEE
jgi:putative phage-type endonuclease